MNRVIISIVNWNTPQRTLACLRALAQLRGDFGVVVVDNASCDDSVAQIQEAFPDVRVLTAPHNGGFAAGHRIGMNYAQAQGAEWVWLLNSDALVEPDTLEALMEAVAQQGIGLYGSVPLDKRGDQTVIAFPVKYFAVPFRERALGYLPEWDYTPERAQHAPLVVSALSGSSLLMPLSVIREHGWMSEGWFMYGEETDYCLRLGRLGVPSRLVFASRVWHGGTGSSGDWRGVSAVIAYYRARNELVFAYRWTTRWITIVFTLKKLLRALVISPKAPLKAWFMLRGVVDAWRGRLGKVLAPEDYWR